MGFQKKIAHGDNSKPFNNTIRSLSKIIAGIAPSGSTFKEELGKLEATASTDNAMAAKISSIKNEIRAVEKKVDAIGEVQSARLYWAQFIEDLKNTKIDVAGRGQANYIWLTSLKMELSQAAAAQYIPGLVDMPGSLYTTAYATSARRSGVDTRPWVIITGYVKIPTHLPGSKPAATANAEKFVKALEVMGQAFVCQKDHRYREDKDTGYLIPVSPDKGPAKAYRYRWDETKKEAVLEGLVAVEAAEGEESPALAQQWQKLATHTGRRKPNWISDGPIQGDVTGMPCPIELAGAKSGARPKTLTRTDGYLDEVEVRLLVLQSDRLASFTVIARFADQFEYPKKSELL